MISISTHWPHASANNVLEQSRANGEIWPTDWWVSWAWYLHPWSISYSLIWKPVWRSNQAWTHATHSTADGTDVPVPSGNAPAWADPKCPEGIEGRWAQACGGAAIAGSPQQEHSRYSRAKSGGNHCSHPSCAGSSADTLRCSARESPTWAPVPPHQGPAAHFSCSRGSCYCNIDRGEPVPVSTPSLASSVKEHCFTPAGFRPGTRLGLEVVKVGKDFRGSTLYHPERTTSWSGWLPSSVKTTGRPSPGSSKANPVLSIISQSHQNSRGRWHQVKLPASHWSGAQPMALLMISRSRSSIDATDSIRT